MHLRQNRHHPVLKLAVIAIGNDQIADAIHALFAQRCAGKCEGAEKSGCEAFDQVLFDAAGGGDDGGDVFVLDEVAQGFAQAGGDEVGGVAEKDGGAFTRFWVFPCYLIAQELRQRKLHVI